MRSNLSSSLESPERRTTSPENRAAYKAFMNSIRDGGCKGKDLVAAVEKGIIDSDQYKLLSALLMDKLERDPLTNVFDRRNLEPELDRLQDELNHVGEKEKRKFPVQSVMVIFFDLKKFKELNDMHGHAVGDKALVIFTERLRKAIKRNDMIFRYGGDEFIAVLPINDKNSRALEIIFERIKNSLSSLSVSNAFNVDVSFGASMGVEIMNKGDSRTAKEVMVEVDKKMYANKRGSQASI